MTASGSLAESVLQALDIAVLRRVGERRYEMYGQIPEFYFRLFGGEGRCCAAPWQYSSALAAFLADAESFFSRRQSGVLTSCLWQENSERQGGSALAATALCAGEDRALVLRFFGDGQGVTARVLQKAKEQLLDGGPPEGAGELPRQKTGIDALTSLPTRNSFMESLAEEMGRIDFSGGDLSLLLLDIDDFKGIEDAYGPLAGDAVLSNLGEVLRTFLRREDLAARYAEKKFAVVARKTTQAQSVSVAEKLRNVISEQGFAALPPITVSIGCATYIRGESAESFLQRAGLALYDAKSNGKNMVRAR